MSKNLTKHLALTLKIDEPRALEAVIKAQLIKALTKTVEKKALTHEMLAKKSGLPRSAITGILSGSLQKVTINRLLRLLEAAGLTAEIKVKEVA